METKTTPKKKSTPTPEDATSYPLPATGSERVPWGPWTAVIYAVAIYFAAQLLASLIIIVYPHLRGWSKPVAENWLDNAVTAQFWYVLFAEALTVAAIWWFVRRRRSSLRVLGWRSPQLRDVGMAIGGYIVYFLVYAVLISVATALIPALNVNQKQQLGFNNPAGSLNLILAFISLVILPPLAEETVFRGFVFSGLKNKLPVVWAALATSALFAVAHLEFGSGQPLLWVAALDTFTLSLVLCYLRQKTNGLWAGIFVHALKNGVAFYALYLVPLIHLKV